MRTFPDDDACGRRQFALIAMLNVTIVKYNWTRPPGAASRLQGEGNPISLTAIQRFAHIVSGVYGLLSSLYTRQSINGS